MKNKLHLLVLSSALLLGLAACGNNPTPTPAPSSETSSSTSSSTSTPSTEPGPSTTSDPAVDYEALAEAAYDSISGAYDAWASDGISHNQTIYLSATVEGVEFSIAYTVSEEAAAFLAVNGNTLVVTTDAEDHRLLNAITVNVSYNGQVYFTQNLNIKVNALVVVNLRDIFDHAKGDNLIVRGKVTALYGTSFFMQDGEYATEVYTTDDYGVEVGDVVEVDGELDIYSGLYEIKNLKSVTKIEASAVTDPVVMNLGADLDVSSAVIGGRLFEGTVKVKTINLGTGSSGYHYVEGKLALDEEGTKTVAVRIDDRYASKEMLATWGLTYPEEGDPVLGDDIEAGDTITLNGILSWYSGAQVALGTVTNITKGEKIVARATQLSELYVTGEEAIADDTLLALKGKIVANYNASSTGGFFIADGEYGAYIYRAALPDGIAVGDYVSLEGSLSTYKQCKEITGAVKIEKLADHSDIAEPVFLDGTAELALNNQARLINLAAAELTEISLDSYGNVSGKAKVGEKVFSFKYDSRYVAETKLAELFGWTKTPKESDPTKYDYAIEAKAGGTMDLVGITTVSEDTNKAPVFSLLGVDGGNYVAPVESNEPELETISIGEALDLGAENIRDRAFSLSGVLEDFGSSPYGNAYLTDPATGKSIRLYGFSNNEEHLTWGGTAYAWSGDNTALDSFKDEGEQYIVANGDLVTVKAIYSPFKGTPQLNALFVEKSEEVTTFTASVVDEDPHGEVLLSKTEGIAYGEEVTVTATPAAGFRLKSLKLVNAWNKETDITETLKFNASAANKVVVTWEEASVPALTTVVDLKAEEATPSSYTNAYTGSFTASANDIQFQFDAINNGSAAGWSDWRLGRKSADSIAVIKSTAAIAHNISEFDLVLTTFSANGLTSAKAYVSADGEAWEEAASFADKMAADTTVEVSLGEKAGENLFFKVEIVMGSTGSNGSIRFSEFKLRG